MRKRKQVLGVVAILVVVFGGLFGAKYYANYRTAVAARHRPAPAVAVSTAVARDMPWSPELNVVGSLQAVEGTEITAQIAGNVTAIAGNQTGKSQLSDQTLMSMKAWASTPGVTMKPRL